MEYSLNYPKTVEEAIDILNNIMLDEDKEKLKQMREDDLFLLHRSLGQWIRNNLGLWNENYELMLDCGVTHEDDASDVIIKAFIKQINY